MATEPMDALVIFGATGDLAKLETFPALVGLVDRGVLDVPVVGVAKSGWGLEQFRDVRRGVAAAQRHGPGQPGRGRRCSACCATSTATSTTTPPTPRCPTRWATAERALFYLEVPPPLFGRIAQGIAGGRPGRRRPGHGGEAVRHRPAPAPRQLNDDDARGLPRGRRSTGSTTGWAWTRWRTCCSPGSPTRSSSRCSTATTWTSVQITMAEAFDVADRGSFYDRTGAIRDVVQNHMLQVLASVLADPPAGSRPRRLAGRRRPSVIGVAAAADAGDTVRGPVRGLPRRRRRRARVDDRDATSRSGSRSTPGAGRTSRSLIRAGKCMPVTATEVADPVPPATARHLRAGRRRRPQPAAVPDLAGERGRAHPGRQEAGRGLDPAGRGARRSPSSAGSDMRPYDRLIGAALDGRAVAVRPAGDRRGGLAGGRPGPRRRASRCTPYAAGQLGAEGGRRAAARRRHLARPGRLSQTRSDHVVDTSGTRPRRDRRRRLRRPVRRPGAAARPGRGHARRPRRAPPVPAAALPVRHRDPVRGADRGAAARPAQAAPQRRLRAGRGRRTSTSRRAAVVAARPGRGHDPSCPYDDLIVAAGVRQSYFGHDEFAPCAPGMKTLADALAIRRRVFGAFEMARDRRPTPAERRRWLTFALVGAGPTGVELAGQIRELATRTLRAEFRRIDPEEARVLLFDGGERAAGRRSGRSSSAKAAEALAEAGRRAAHALAGHRRRRATAWWCATRTARHALRRRHRAVDRRRRGARRSPSMLAKATGAEQDRAGRIKVQPDLTIPGHPEISVVGDLMSLDKLPGVAEVAMQSGCLRRPADPAGRRWRAAAKPASRSATRPRLGRVHLPRSGGRSRSGRCTLAGPARLAGLAVHPHRVPDRLPQPGRGGPDLGVAFSRGVPPGAGLHDAGDRDARGRLLAGAPDGGLTGTLKSYAACR